MTLSKFAIGTWTPCIGDSSLMGWFTVISYYSVASMCIYLAVWTNHKNRKIDKTFELFVCAYLAFLGVCKQFNLPSAITEIGRMFFSAEGWYGNRRPIQMVMMTAFCIALTSASVILFYRFKNLFFGRFQIVSVFILYLFAFVVLRGISLHQYERILDYRILGLRINWIGELAGIFGIAFFMIQTRLSKSGV